MVLIEIIGEKEETEESQFAVKTKYKG